MFPHPNPTFCTEQIVRIHVQFGLTCSFEKCAVLQISLRGACVTLSYYGSSGVVVTQQLLWRINGEDISKRFMKTNL